MRPSSSFKEEDVTILTLNCGSSSVKYQLYDWNTSSILARGAVERVTVGDSFITHAASGKEEHVEKRDCPSHLEAIAFIIEMLEHGEYGVISDIRDVSAVGHRVVHGGDRFKKSVMIDDAVVETFKSFSHLAPLHLPANIMGIEAARNVLPSVPHCAIMDTAWHQTMEETAFMYALPYEWYTKHRVRRYGFHGTSFLYCAKRAAVLVGKDPFETSAIICHIGNGSSVCAVRNGVSIDTSMGLTPLEGLVMGTRSGDCDPAIAFYMMRETGMSVDEIDSVMNKKSGLLGITGDLVDRRDIVAAAEGGNERARLAVELEAYRLRKYIGAYVAAIGKVDALVFTAGVGERQPIIRWKTTEGLDHIGIGVDEWKNTVSFTRNAETDISTDGSPTKTFVIPTDEELVMTEDTYALVTGTYDVHTSFEYTFQKPDYRNHDREKRFELDLVERPGLAKIRAMPAGAAASPT
jgi:acetate kinase